MNYQIAKNIASFLKSTHCADLAECTKIKEQGVVAEDNDRWYRDARATIHSCFMAIESTSDIDDAAIQCYGKVLQIFHCKMCADHFKRKGKLWHPACIDKQCSDIWCHN